jgi:hypothetical protein
MDADRSDRSPKRNPSGERDATDDADEARSTPQPPNPPRTVTGKFVAPKFGSAGSGGAELEPGPERD